MTGNQLKAGLAIALLAVLTACSPSVAPKYTALPEHINQMREAGLASVKVGEFTADPAKGDSVNHLTIRGSAYTSPYEGSYVNYLKESLRQELDEARLLDSNANAELTGVLIENEMNRQVGPGEANAWIKARFVVKRDGKVRYDKVKSVLHQWKSEFAGNVAIPLARENYPFAVQKLVGELFSDADFITALKK